MISTSIEGTGPTTTGGQSKATELPHRAIVSEATHNLLTLLSAGIDSIDTPATAARCCAHHSGSNVVHMRGTPVTALNPQLNCCKTLRSEGPRAEQFRDKYIRGRT